MATYKFNENKDEELLEALRLYSRIADLNLLCVPNSFIEAIIFELDERGIEVDYNGYFRG